MRPSGPSAPCSSCSARSPDPFANSASATGLSGARDSLDRLAKGAEVPFKQTLPAGPLTLYELSHHLGKLCGPHHRVEHLVLGNVADSKVKDWRTGPSFSAETTNPPPRTAHLSHP
jgi:hypothetical protein